MQQANSPLEVLTKDDLVEWFMQPVTKKIRFKVEQEIKRSMVRVCSDYVLALESVEKTALLTAREVGYMEGLDFLFKIEADE